eukprot:g13774.t1
MNLSTRNADAHRTEDLVVLDGEQLFEVDEGDFVDVDDEAGRLFEEDAFDFALDDADCAGAWGTTDADVAFRCLPDVMADELSTKVCRTTDSAHPGGRRVDLPFRGEDILIFLQPSKSNRDAFLTGWYQARVVELSDSLLTVSWANPELDRGEKLSLEKLLWHSADAEQQEQQEDDLLADEQKAPARKKGRAPDEVKVNVKTSSKKGADNSSGKCKSPPSTRTTGGKPPSMKVRTKITAKAAAPAPVAVPDVDDKNKAGSSSAGRELDGKRLKLNEAVDEHVDLEFANQPPPYGDGEDHELERVRGAKHCAWFGVNPDYTVTAPPTRLQPGALARDWAYRRRVVAPLFSGDEFASHLYAHRFWRQMAQRLYDDSLPAANCLDDYLVEQVKLRYFLQMHTSDGEFWTALRESIVPDPTRTKRVRVTHQEATQTQTASVDDSTGAARRSGGSREQSAAGYGYWLQWSLRKKTKK